jgi:hypothetical protein
VSTVPAFGIIDTTVTTLVGLDFVNREQHALDSRVYRDVEEECKSSV